jgi:hypothetical protein
MGLTGGHSATCRLNHTKGVMGFGGIKSELEGEKRFSNAGLYM